MTTNSITQEVQQLELRLIENLTRRQDLFTKAMALTESLPSCLDAGDYGQTILQEVNMTLVAASELEASSAPIQSRWKELGGKAEGHFALLVQTVQKLLEELLGRISLAEEKASAAKHRLGPQASLQVNSQRMLNAYGKAASQ